MAVARDVRRARFGRFIARALKEAADRGMTIRQIEEATNLKKTKIYRWKDGDWTRDPQASDVKAFCEGLGVPFRLARQTLGWDETQDAAAPEPVLDPDLAALARRLQDPNLSEAERYHIRETVRSLARRGDEPHGRGSRAG